MTASPNSPSTNESHRAIRAEQRRLCAIVDSNQASTDEKYQALIDLAVSLDSSLTSKSETTGCGVTLLAMS